MSVEGTPQALVEMPAPGLRPPFNVMPKTLNASGALPESDTSSFIGIASIAEDVIEVRIRRRRPAPSSRSEFLQYL